MRTIPMLECPRCAAPALKITIELELGRDGNADEVSIQAMQCLHCGLTAAANYEEGRRGERERWHHFATRITMLDYDKLVASLGACSRRRNPDCACNAHRWFGQRSELGSLRPLELVPAIHGSGFEPTVSVTHPPEARRGRS